LPKNGLDRLPAGNAARPSGWLSDGDDGGIRMTVSGWGFEPTVAYGATSDDPDIQTAGGQLWFHA
jgi:hypothetical protein